MMGKEGYDVVMRLDDDGFLLSSIEIDVFELMREHGFEYAFRRVNKGLHASADDTLIPLTLGYLKSKGVRIECDISDVNTQHFYNNFYITDVKHLWMRRWRFDSLVSQLTTNYSFRDVQEFLRFINDTGGIWKYNWGDSLIMALVVKVFLPPASVVQLTGFAYEHGSHHTVVSESNADWRFRVHDSESIHSQYLCELRIIDVRARNADRASSCFLRSIPVYKSGNMLCDNATLLDSFG
jgi:hypothetical protein